MKGVKGAMLTMTQFAAKVRKSRQRVHQLMREGRIRPAPEWVGGVYIVSDIAKIIKDLTRVNGKRKR